MPFLSNSDIINNIKYANESVFSSNYHNMQSNLKNKKIASDCLAILGINNQNDAEFNKDFYANIKKLFRKLSLLTHPDKNNGNDSLNKRLNNLRACLEIISSQFSLNYF